MGMITLTSKDIDNLNRVVATEVDHKLAFSHPKEYAQQVQGVVDTILNRLASGRWGDTVADVANAKNQFSAINGPKTEKYKVWGSVELVPLDDPDIVPGPMKNVISSWLTKRKAGEPSSVGGGLNYANPKFSDAKNLGWINALDGPKYGYGDSTHYHGTVKGQRPVEAVLGRRTLWGDMAATGPMALPPRPASLTRGIDNARTRHAMNVANTPLPRARPGLKPLPMPAPLVAPASKPPNAGIAATPQLPRKLPNAGIAATPQLPKRSMMDELFGIVTGVGGAPKTMEDSSFVGGLGSLLRSATPPPAAVVPGRGTVDRTPAGGMVNPKQPAIGPKFVPPPARMISANPANTIGAKPPVKGLVLPVARAPIPAGTTKTAGTVTVPLVGPVKKSSGAGAVALPAGVKPNVLPIVPKLPPAYNPLSSIKAPATSKTIYEKQTIQVPNPAYKPPARPAPIGAMSYQGTGLTFAPDPLRKVAAPVAPAVPQFLTKTISVPKVISVPGVAPMLPGMVPGAMGVPRAPFGTNDVAGKLGFNPLFGSNAGLLGGLLSGQKTVMPQAGNGLFGLLGGLFNGQVGGMFGGRQPGVPSPAGKLSAAPKITEQGGGGAFIAKPGTPASKVGSKNSLLPKSMNTKRWETGY